MVEGGFEDEAVCVTAVQPFDPETPIVRVRLKGNNAAQWVGAEPRDQGTPRELRNELAGRRPDEIGRDLYTRILFGARISLTIAFSVVIIEVLLGALVGAVAGYYGGWVDGLLMRVTDAFLSIPLLPLLLVLSGIVAASSSKAALNFASIVVIIALLSWMNVARLVRGSFLSLREKEFTEAARAIGSGDARIVIRHLLPNAVAPIVVQATLDVGGVILLESALSFLGYGIQPPTASWGSMLANAQENITIAPWAAIYPGLAILLTVLAINYMGDGLRDAIDPNVQ